MIATSSEDQPAFSVGPVQDDLIDCRAGFRVYVYSPLQLALLEIPSGFPDPGHIESCIHVLWNDLALYTDFLTAGLKAGR